MFRQSQPVSEERPTDAEVADLARLMGSDVILDWGWGKHWACEGDTTHCEARQLELAARRQFLPGRGVQPVPWPGGP